MKMIFSTRYDPTNVKPMCVINLTKEEEMGIYYFYTSLYVFLNVYIGISIRREIFRGVSVLYIKMEGSQYYWLVNDALLILNL